MFSAIWAHFSAVVSIFRRRKLLILSAIPWCTGIGLFIVALAVGWVWSVSIAELLGITDYLPRWLSGISVAVVTIIIASILAALGTVGLSSLLLETFIQVVLDIETPSVPFSVKQLMVTGLVSVLQIGLLLVLGVIVIMLSFIPFFVIPAFVLAAFVTGLDLSLTALNVQGYSLRPALRAIMRHPLQVIIIGAPLVIPIPLLPILLLPVAAHAAATLSQHWLSSEQPLRA